MHSLLWIQRGPSSAVFETIDKKEATNGDGPLVAIAAPYAGGPRRTTRKEATDSMHSVEPSTETPPPIAACPTCGETAKHAGYVTEKGIVTGNYTCNLNHIWITRWLAVAA